MLDTQVTVVGNVVTDPRMSLTKDKQAFTTFRIASTPRRFDRSSGQWRDGDTSFLGVTCWRGLAENTAACLKKGQTVIVVGRLSVRLYENREGQQRQSTEIDAAAVGPDLGRVVAIVKRAERSISAAADQSGDADELADLEIAEMTGGGQPDLASIDWSYAEPLGTEPLGTEPLGSAPEETSEPLAGVSGRSVEVVSVEEAPELPVELPVPVLVGAGGRGKGRSGGS